MVLGGGGGGGGFFLLVWGGGGGGGCNFPGWGADREKGGGGGWAGGGVEYGLLWTVEWGARGLVNLPASVANRIIGEEAIISLSLCVCFPSFFFFLTSMDY